MSIEFKTSSIVELDAAYRRGDAKLKAIVQSADDLTRAWFTILDRTYDQVCRGDTEAQNELIALETQITFLADKIRAKTDQVLSFSSFPTIVT